MKKKIKRYGINGVQTGEIIIKKNSGSKTVKQYNPVWHDTKQVRVKTHSITVMVNGKEYKSYNDITSDRGIEEKQSLVEQELTKHLEYLVNRDTTTFEDRMKDKGYE